MLAFLLRRILATIPTLLVVVTVSFSLIHLAPGGPFDKDRALPPEVMASLEAAYHLDWPVFPVYRSPEDLGGGWQILGLMEWRRTQYADYLLGLLHGDLGVSTRYPGVTVASLLSSGFGPTATIGLLALLLSLVGGLASGLLAGWKPNTLADNASMAVVMVGISVPSFVLAPILVLLFAVGLQWLPVAGFTTVRHLILPSGCLAALNAAYIARLSRSSMREIMPQDFVRTARAMGHSESSVVFIHALRGVLIPVVSFLGPAIAGILTGSLVIESIFNVPGIGRHFVQAALNRDYTLVMGTVVFYSMLLLAANLLVDLAYAWLDPRMRDA